MTSTRQKPAGADLAGIASQPAESCRSGLKTGCQIFQYGRVTTGHRQTAHRKPRKIVPAFTAMARSVLEYVSAEAFNPLLTCWDAVATAQNVINPCPAAPVRAEARAGWPAEPAIPASASTASPATTSQRPCKLLTSWLPSCSLAALTENPWPTPTSPFHPAPVTATPIIE